MSDHLWYVLPQRWRRGALCYRCFGELTGLPTRARDVPTVAITASAAARSCIESRVQRMARQVERLTAKRR
ncbi:MAG: hypothetical protein ACHREM_00075 [Polyangiales bacterium]